MIRCMSGLMYLMNMELLKERYSEYDELRCIINFNVWNGYVHRMINI